MKIYEKLKNQDLSPQDKKLVNDIEKYGFAVINVSGEDDKPSFSYSIGLYDNYKHPEIIIIGLPQELSQMMIQHITLDIKDGKNYEAEKKYNDLLEGYKCFFKEMDIKHYKEYLGWANWYYSGDDFPTLQCVWPDKKEKFPWQKDFDSSFINIQPVLD